MTDKVYTITNGCLENQIDTASMEGLLKDNGWQEAETLYDASLILVNVCGLTKKSEDASINLIKYVKENSHPSSKLVVCGCLPKINNERLKQIYDGFTFGSDDNSGLCKIANIENACHDTSANYLMPRKKEIFEIKSNGNGNGRRHSKFSSILDPNAYIKKMTYPYYRRLENKTLRMYPNDFYIKVSTGCLNSCSYCAVKISRGHIKSKPIEKIVTEFENGLRKGFREFGLIGTDLGSYGKDHGVNLATLLRELVSKRGNFNIKLRNVNPRFLIDMLPELKECFKSGKINHISSAAQSGSNRILSLMNREYRIEDYQHAISSVQKDFPFIQFRTQLMVGFPGETKDDFLKTVKLLNNILFDFIELYKYSPRPNTVAANFDEKLPEEVIDRRYNKLYKKALINIAKKRYFHSPGSGNKMKKYGHVKKLAFLILRPHAS